MLNYKFRMGNMTRPPARWDESIWKTSVEEELFARHEHFIFFLPNAWRFNQIIEAMTTREFLLIHSAHSARSQYFSRMIQRDETEEKYRCRWLSFDKVVQQHKHWYG